jgi:hypothetical protein
MNYILTKQELDDLTDPEKWPEERRKEFIDRYVTRAANSWCAQALRIVENRLGPDRNFYLGLAEELRAIKANP